MAAATTNLAGATKPAAMAAAVESVVVVHNVAKRHNVGTLARSATAFGVAEVVVVGRRDVSAFGSHGATSHLRFRHFSSLALARAYLKASKQASPLFWSSNP
jgi:tRNA G18 (ribose-2'-O)-methylase SpoU